MIVLWSHSDHLRIFTTSLWDFCVFYNDFYLSIETSFLLNTAVISWQEVWPRQLEYDPFWSSNQKPWPNLQSLPQAVSWTEPTLCDWDMDEIGHGNPKSRRDKPWLVLNCGTVVGEESLFRFPWALTFLGSLRKLSDACWALEVMNCGLAMTSW